MALNQVIHGSNRVVENPNRYKLNPVAGQSNTYDFEKQPGVITDNGTPYNKRILDQIDNVLSYLIPNVEKVGSSITKNAKFYLQFPNSINGNHINAFLKNDDDDSTLNATFEIIGTSATNGYRVNSSSSNHYINVFARNPSIVADIPTMNGILKRNDLDNVYVDFSPYSESSSYAHQITIDLTNNVNNKLDYKFTRNHTIKYSFDNINYTTIKSHTGYDKIDEIIDIPNNCYLRITFDNGSFNMYKFNIYTDLTLITYENQFILDNNTSFTNNQRVLIETPTTNDYNIKQDFITSVDGLNAVNSDGFIITAKSLNPSGIFSLANSVNGNFDDNGYASEWNTIINNEEYIIYEFPRTLNFSKIIERINWDSWAFTRPKLSYSNDGVTYIDLIDVGTSDDTKSEHLVNFAAKYIKISATTTSTTGNTYLRVKEINFYTQEGMTTDGVVSNTLNGIDIPTLLQPSTKYELIYKEDSNKFNVKPDILYDITLSEAVNQVDLTGISDMLKIGKVYALYIYGGTSRTNSVNVIMGTGNVTDAESNFVRTPFIFSLILKDNSNVLIGGCNNSTSSTSNYASSNLLNNEYIKLASNQTFNAGTRIIIKEVA